MFFVNFLNFSFFLFIFSVFRFYFVYLSIRFHRRHFSTFFCFFFPITLLFWYFGFLRIHNSHTHIDNESQEEEKRFCSWWRSIDAVLFCCTCLYLFSRHQRYDILCTNINYTIEDACRFIGPKERNFFPSRQVIYWFDGFLRIRFPFFALCVIQLWLT